MQKYSHNYSLPSNAENHLFYAQEYLRMGQFAEAEKFINKARQTLQQYLSKDNMVPDDDVYDGWYKASDVEQELERTANK